MRLKLIVLCSSLFLLDASQHVVLGNPASAGEHGEQMTLGMTLKNPFNIRKTQTDWLGEIDGTDNGFETFQDFPNGLRAGFRVLLTYFNKHKINTVSKIVQRFAPAPENNTAGYANFVSRRLAADPTDVLDPTDHLLLNLAKAMITFEQGQQPFTDKELKEALDAARR